MLKIGFLVPDDEGSERSFACFFPDFLAADFTEGSCPREKRSEVALGMFAVDTAEAIEKGKFLHHQTGRAELSDNARPPLTLSATDSHGPPSQRPRDGHQVRLPDNRPGNRGHVLGVWGKLLRVHRQPRQSPKIPVTQQQERVQLKCFTGFQAFEGKTTLARHRLGNSAPGWRWGFTLGADRLILWFSVNEVLKKEIAMMHAFSQVCFCFFSSPRVGGAN